RSCGPVTEQTGTRPQGWTQLDDRAVTAIRGLAMDAVEKVGNGHPGTAMSLAPVAYHLFQHVLRHDPADPTWVGRDRFVLSAGHMEEGVSSEASSIAGVQRLGNLVLVWDDNHISIEDDTAIAFSEDTTARYAAYGWHTQYVDMLPSGEADVAGFAAALEAARAETERPSFIALRTVIGWPAPKLQNTGKAHGSAL